MEEDTIEFISDSGSFIQKEIRVFQEEKPAQADQIKYNSSWDVNHQKTPDWFLYISLFLLISLAWIKLVYGRFLLGIFSALANFQLSQKLFNDPGIVRKRLSQSLLLIYFISSGLFLYELAEYFNFTIIPFQGIKLFFSFVAILMVLALIRFIIMSLTAYFFKKQKLFSAYLFQHFLNNKVLGIILIPIAIAIAYSRNQFQDILVYFSLGIVIISFIMKLIRATQFIFKNVISLFYLILYLCILEILPVLVIIKLLKSLL
jgi:Domain of unknown function (DUF4271)